MHQELRAFESEQVYDEINYFRFVYSQSSINPIFREAQGEAGKVYRPPVIIPTLHVNHDEGGNQNTPDGFYFNDVIYVTCEFDQLYRTGLVFQDIRTNKYLKDRFIYDTRVFRVTNMDIEGQIRERDMIVQITGTAVKPDELVDDPQFAGFIDEGPFSDGEFL